MAYSGVPIVAPPTAPVAVAVAAPAVAVAAPAVAVAAPATAQYAYATTAAPVAVPAVAVSPAPGGSGTLRKRYGGAPVTRDTLGEFDQKSARANQLKAADAQLSTAKAQQATVLKKLPKVTHMRTDCELDIHKLEKRIHGNETNPVFRWSVAQPQTWFSGGVTEKIKKLQDELQQLQDRHTAASISEKELTQQKQELASKMPGLEQAAAEKLSVSKRACEIFENTVHMYPSPALQALEQNAQQWVAAVTFERVNTVQLREVLEQMGAARNAYYNAMNALQSAMSMNQGAQMTNIMGGPYERFEGIETLQEMQRNRLMQEAKHMAEMGGQQLASAFSAIPPAARQRYPSLCVELGAVHVPDIEEMGLGSMMMQVFGGQIVDFAVNMQAQQKIRASMGRLAECEQIVARQEALCTALLDAIHRDGDAAAARLSDVNGKIFTEKIQVFNYVRTSNGMTPSAADAFTTAFEGGRNIAFVAASVGQHSAAAAVQRAHRNVRAQREYDDFGLF